MLSQHIPPPSCIGPQSSIHFVIWLVHFHHGLLRILHFVCMPFSMLIGQVTLMIDLQLVPMLFSSGATPFPSPLRSRGQSLDHLLELNTWWLISISSLETSRIQTLFDTNLWVMLIFIIIKMCKYDER